MAQGMVPFGESVEFLNCGVEAHGHLEVNMKITLRHATAMRAVVLLLLGLIPAALAAQQPKMNMVKIADDVYTMVEAGGSSNSTFIITSDGVVVFDHYLTESDQTLAAIRKLTEDRKSTRLNSSHVEISYAVFC